MLSKIISIRNTGRFLNSASSPSPTFKQHNFVFAPNAAGKSTLCAVMRSFADGDIDEITGRMRLGNDDKPEAEFLFDGKKETFNGNAWSRSDPPVSVFDDAFIQ